MEMKSPPPTCPKTTTTVRRNPPRRARPTPSTNIPKAPTPSSSNKVPDIRSFPIDDILSIQIPENPKPHPSSSTSSTSPSSENINVYLRIKPLIPPPKLGDHTARSRPKNVWPQNPTKKNAAKEKTVKNKSNEVCLTVNDSSSVTLSPPMALQLNKRIKSEVYEGFSHVFSADSSQGEVFEKMVSPLVEDFLRGKSGMLAALGPSGSGKTHTIFGTTREPGMVPLALKRIFKETTTGPSQSSRSFYLSVFEINTERGKGERMLDLSPDGADLSMQKSAIKGLKEVVISDAAQAESCIALAMLKRATAMTNTNSQSSRSQCIINIRSIANELDGEGDMQANNAVLTIVDLAGAEREKRTGNQGARLLESNFINNTSMVIGVCLRALLEHQKNPKKPLQKHCQNSLLTRYLRDYLEGKKKMTLILTVKSGEEDYLDTSNLLRQASPYMKIKFDNVEDLSNSVCNKRHPQTLSRLEQPKKMKFSGPQACSVNVSDKSQNIVKASECNSTPKNCDSTPRIDTKVHSLDLEASEHNSVPLKCDPTPGQDKNVLPQVNVSDESQNIVKESECNSTPKNCDSTPRMDTKVHSLDLEASEHNSVPLKCNPTPGQDINVLPQIDEGISFAEKHQLSEEDCSKETLRMNKLDVKDLAPVKLNSVDLANKERIHQITQKFAKASWTVLKEYKEKLKVAESEMQSLRENLSNERTRNLELEKELKDRKSCCTCYKESFVEVTTADTTSESKIESEGHKSEVGEADVDVPPLNLEASECSNTPLKCDPTPDNDKDVPPKASECNSSPNNCDSTPRTNVNVHSLNLEASEHKRISLKCDPTPVQDKDKDVLPQLMAPECDSTPKNNDYTPSADVDVRSLTSECCSTPFKSDSTSGEDKDVLHQIDVKKDSPNLMASECNSSPKNYDSIPKTDLDVCSPNLKVSEGCRTPLKCDPSPGLAKDELSQIDANNDSPNLMASESNSSPKNYDSIPKIDVDVPSPDSKASEGCSTPLKCDHSPGQDKDELPQINAHKDSQNLMESDSYSTPKNYDSIPKTDVDDPSLNLKSSEGCSTPLKCDPNTTGEDKVVLPQINVNDDSPNLKASDCNSTAENCDSIPSTEMDVCCSPNIKASEGSNIPLKCDPTPEEPKEELPQMNDAPNLKLCKGNSKPKKHDFTLSQDQQLLAEINVVSEPDGEASPDSSHKPLNKEKPKRRLLPASSMLLRDISALGIQDENEKPKVSRIGKKGVENQGKKTQGSITLLRLLKNQ